MINYLKYSFGLIFFILSSYSSAMPKYLLVFCSPPCVDTIWNYESWLHKKDTSFVLTIRTLPIRRYYEYRYNYKNESHLIICYHPGYTSKLKYDFMDTSNPYFTVTMKLRNKCLVKHGCFTWYLRVPMIDFYKNNYLKQRIVYYKPRINHFRYPVLRQFSHESFCNENNSCKLFFDTLGQIIEINKIKNRRTKYSNRPNNILTPNDMIIEKLFDIDTLKDVLRKFEQKNDTLFLLQCDTFKNNTILVQYIRKQGKYIKLINNKYLDNISEQSLSYTDIITCKKKSSQYYQYIKHENKYNYIENGVNLKGNGTQF